ncbi:hypothetical protein ACLMJK_003664 [Lecanora helva]
MVSKLILAITSLTLLPSVLSHGHQVPISDDADWATRHMAGKLHSHLPHRTLANPLPLPTEEHHIANLDPSAFFTLHDYDNTGAWTAHDIRRTYGLDDETAKDIDSGKKEDITKIVVEIFDRDGDGMVSREEWMEGWVREGKRLPDFGVGSVTFLTAIGYEWDAEGLRSWEIIAEGLRGGSRRKPMSVEENSHHGDDEYEYEIHHFEKFHDENTKEEDLTHPEDIAHFRKHDEMDAAAEYQERIDSMPIVEQNIPQKFRRY